MVLIALVLLLLPHFPAVSPHVLLEKSSSNDFGDTVTVERSVGTVAKLKCNSNNISRVHWTKNGRRISCSKGGCRPTLKVTDLASDDEGVYQCWLPPGLPANPTYTLKISPVGVAATESGVAGASGPPEVEGPGNLSAPLGTAIALRCSIVSSLTPNIQWLRKLPDGPLEGPPRPQKVLKYEGVAYEVLTPSGVAAISNNTWITKLVLNKLNEKDSGFYVCVATNNHGFQFRGGFVTVTQKALATDVESGRSEVLYIEVILIATVFMLLATTALALLYFAHWNRQASRQPVNL